MCYWPLVAAFLYITAFSVHSLSVRLDCTWKTDVTADPPSSDFHDLAEIGGKKSDFFVGERLVAHSTHSVIRG